MFCTCSRNCVYGKCPCLDDGLLFTDPCAKQGVETLCFGTGTNEVADFLSFDEEEN